MAKTGKPCGRIACTLHTLDLGGMNLLYYDPVQDFEPLKIAERWEEWKAKCEGTLWYKACEKMANANIQPLTEDLQHCMNIYKDFQLEVKASVFCIEWRENGKLHRYTDSPACIFPHGMQWWKNGEHHRDGDKPAVIHKNGYQAWWKDGKRHRDGDKPAVICTDGTQEWWKAGKRHRSDDKPAVVYPSGNKEWWTNGDLRRIVFANGNIQLWDNGQVAHFIY